MATCPACQKEIRHDVSICPYCSHQMTAQQMEIAALRQQLANQEKPKNNWKLAAGLVGLIVLLALLGRCGGNNGPATPVPISESSPVGSLPPALSIRVDRFAWENGGSTCEASAKITNTSDVPLTGVRLTAQFMKGEELIVSDWSFIEPTENWLPGQAGTWDDLYDCPKVADNVELLASSQEGALEVKVIASGTKGGPVK